MKWDKALSSMVQYMVDSWSYFPFICTQNHIESFQKEGNVLFKDPLNSFCLQLYGIGHMVNNQSDNKRKNHCHH